MMRAMIGLVLALGFSATFADEYVRGYTRPIGGAAMAQSGLPPGPLDAWLRRRDINEAAGQMETLRQLQQLQMMQQIQEREQQRQWQEQQMQLQELQRQQMLIEQEQQRQALQEQQRLYEQQRQQILEQQEQLRMAREKLAQEQQEQEKKAMDRKRGKKAQVSASVKPHQLPRCPVSQLKATWTNCVGTRYYANGDKYEGEFKGGRFHGYGIIKDPKGLIVRLGTWENGDWVSAK